MASSASLLLRVWKEVFLLLLTTLQEVKLAYLVDLMLSLQESNIKLYKEIYLIGI